ncbi:MAG: biotin--[acetyl-CoA-carboxylase] ligase [Mangrovibacterium sp.]
MKSPIIGQSIVRLERVGSTNNYASGQLRENEIEEGTVFLAVSQTAGRGQQTNQWESEDGKNLTFSLILRPAFLEIKDQFMLSKVVCLGLHRFLSDYVDDVRIKWPNDIYVGDRKICGILIENAIMGARFSTSVIGIGLNINQLVFLSDAPNPVSLAQLTGQQYNHDKLLNELLAAIGHYYSLLRNGETETINKAFHENLYWLNEWCPFKDEAHCYTGKICGVNEIGQLRVQEQDGPMHDYHFKEVSYLNDFEQKLRKTD